MWTPARGPSDDPARLLGGDRLVGEAVRTSGSSRSTSRSTIPRLSIPGCASSTATARHRHRGRAHRRPGPPPPPRTGVGRADADRRPTRTLQNKRPPPSPTAPRRRLQQARFSSATDAWRGCRHEVEGVRAPQFRRLLEECERYRTVVLPTEHPAASITYFGPAAANLALAYRITGQQHYLDELRRWLAPPLSFPHWGKANMPDHDLDAGWLLHGLAPGLRLGRGRPARGRAQPRSPTSCCSRAGGSTSSRWKPKATGGRARTGRTTTGSATPVWPRRLRTGGLRSGDPGLDRAGQGPTSARCSGMLPEDGSNYEGVVYWRYGVPWLVNYLDVLEDAEGIDLFAASDYLRETFWYRLYQAAPDFERIIDHGDCHDRRSGHSVAMYYKLAAEVPHRQAQWLADQVSRAVLLARGLRERRQARRTSRGLPGTALVRPHGGAVQAPSRCRCRATSPTSAWSWAAPRGTTTPQWSRSRQRPAAGTRPGGRRTS